eukprot:gene12412-biopygen5193
MMARRDSPGGRLEQGCQVLQGRWRTAGGLGGLLASLADLADLADGLGGLGGLRWPDLADLADLGPLWRTLFSFSFLATPREGHNSFSSVFLPIPARSVQFTCHPPRGTEQFSQWDKRLDAESVADPGRLWCTVWRTWRTPCTRLADLADWDWEGGL